MANKRRPISRLHKFYDDIDFNMENEMAREFVEGDLNFTVVLFKVDRIKSQTDDVYGETSANEIKFHAPKEIKVRPLLDAPESNTYSEGYGRYQDYGQFTFTVFVDHLTELNTDIDYGDYIGYPDFEDNIKYFTVTDDGKIFSDNAHTRVGYKGYYRTIKCVTADANEFKPNY